MVERTRRSRTGASQRRRAIGAAPGTTTTAQLIGPVVAVLLTPVPAVQAAWWADPATRQRPLVIAPPGERVLAVCPMAADVGLRPGQTMAQARLRCPRSCVVAPDRAVAAALWRAALRALAEEVAPVVEAADATDGIIYLDAQGLEQLVGDVSVVAQRVLAALAAQGIAARVGAGPGRVVARALAARMDERGPRTLHGEAARAFLHDLPLDDPALGLDEAIATGLRELGIVTAGLFATLPERSLGLRFGPDAMRAWRQARGLDEPPLLPWAAPRSRTATARLEEAVENSVIIAALLRRLAGDLAAWLQDGGHATATLALSVTCETGVRCVHVADQDPPLHDERAIVAATLELWERLPVPAPVAEVTLEAGDLTRPLVEQDDLWGTGVDPLARRQERLARTLAAHARQYGRDHLQRVRPDRRTLDGWRWDGYEP